MIDQDRFAERFREMSAIGRTRNGGVHRLALTDEDKDCRDLLKSWCKEVGLQLQVDRMGSMFATLAGRDQNAPPLLIGSHLDSQPYAGAFDGPLGVLAGLEVIEALIDHGITPEIPVQLVNWTNEEGARFRPPLVASAVFAGSTPLEHGLASIDSDGVSIKEELKRIGYTGSVDPGWKIRGYIELHIEQGTTLEKADAPIGIVTGGVGLTDIRVQVFGEDTHAGPLSMRERRDALVGAAEMIASVPNLAIEDGEDARMTVGRISVPSDSHSVVPGLAEFTLDIRHPSGVGLARLEEKVRVRFETIAVERRLEVTFEKLWQYPPFEFDPDFRLAIASAARSNGYQSLELPSRAGHDAWNMSRVAPSALIFIPCKDGVSHNEKEYASMEHMVAGTQVLFDAVKAIAMNG